MIDQIKNFPFVRILRKIKYDQKFKKNKNLNLFRGVYSSFDQAMAAIPKGVNPGYDNSDSAQMYKHLCEQIFAADYPNLLWLSKIFKEGCQVFDLGGHIGIKYYSYQKYIDFPQNFNWTVSDVPAVVKEGKKWSEKQNALHLTFSTQIDGFNGYDILFALGSLQYIDFDLGAALKKMELKPHHIIISAPLTHLPTFYSVNNIGTAYCVYVLRNEEEFIKSISDAGYKLVDQWINEGKRCEIPFYPDHSIEGYRGIYFTRN